MKLIVVVLLALTCSMVIGASSKFCASTSFYYDGTSCKPCPAGCLECVWKNSQVSCINCQPGTGKYMNIVNDLGTCGDCTANCLACQGPAATDCMAAKEGYMIAPTGVFKCAIPNCKFCSVDNVCARCDFKFRVNNGACSACTDDSCVECPEAPSKCSKCIINTALSNGACQKCHTACQGCPCTACDPGFKFQANTCTACTVANCATCSKDVTKCETCLDGFWMSNNVCTACPANCATCDGAGKCATCKEGFMLNAGTCNACSDTCNGCSATGQCLACKPNYFLAADKTCTACPAGCATCSSATVCTKCQDGFVTTSTGCKSIVATCKKGEQLETSGSCTDTPIDNCVYGNGETKTCFQCANGYYNKDATCAPCQNGCETCHLNTTSGYLTCTEIAQGSFSILETTDKADKTGYPSPDTNALLVSRTNTAVLCKAGFLHSLTLKDPENLKCLAWEKCANPYKMEGMWACILDSPKTAVSLAVSLFTVLASALLVF